MATKTLPQVSPNDAVQNLHAYVPGEQPQGSGFVKLNTNELPYVAPHVCDALRDVAAEAALNKYPNPPATPLRAALADKHGLLAEQVIVGNGSDEILRLLCHAYLVPGSDHIATLDPTYSLYDVLAATFGAPTTRFPLAENIAVLPDAFVASDAKIVFVANPNPPYGTLFSAAELSRLAEARPERLVVVDEAYVDFSPTNCVSLLDEHPNVVVTRTFSKSYGLAGMRVGYALAHEEIIAQLDKIRDSYNVNRASQAAALAALQAQDYYTEKCAEIVASRELLARELEARGFRVAPSHGNFLFARHPKAEAVYTALKNRKVLVRHFSAPALRDGVRITIGTPEELTALLENLDAVLRDLSD